MSMENVSDSNETSLDVKTDLWLADVVISFALLVFACYLFVALMYHKLKVENPIREDFFSLSTEKRYRFLSSYTCIVIGCFSVIRQIYAVGSKLAEHRALSANETLEENTIELFCKVFPSIGNVAITFGGGACYVFLWFRQRVFYVHPSLKVLSNKFVNFVSYLIIAAWLLYCVCLHGAYFTIVRHHFKRPAGCVVEERFYASYTKIVISWTVVSILMQIGLLFLFIYPITKTAKWKGQQQRDINSSLLQRVKKAIILTSICLVTDVLTIIVRTFLISINGSIILFIFSSNLVVNHMVTIACFDYWRKLLWPWSFRLRNAFTGKQKTKIYVSPNLDNATTTSSVLTSA